MKGRKPKPMALKILEGDRSDRVNYREPQLPEASLEPPGWLDGYGREHWNELAPMLVKAGVMRSADRGGLAQLCDDYSTIRKAIEGPPAKEGEVIEWEQAKAIATNADKARDRYRRMLVEFGLTPSSRSRLKSTLEPPKDPLGVFLEGKKKQA